MIWAYGRGGGSKMDSRHNRNPYQRVLRIILRPTTERPDLSLRRVNNKCAYGHLSIPYKKQGNREYGYGPPEHVLVLSHAAIHSS